MVQPNVVITLLRRLAVKVACGTLLLVTPCHAMLAQTPPNLGTAANFAVLGGSAVTCTSATITGNVGVSPGCAVTTCTPSGGTVHACNAIAQQACADFLAAHAALASLPGDACTTQAGNLGGLTLPPGIYCLDDTLKAGTLTLDGPSNGIWVFKVGTGGTGALTATDFSVVKSGGGGACNDNVFWWTDQHAALTTSTLLGTILAGTYVTLTGGTLDGRALAKAAVTLTGPFVGWPATPVPPAVTGPSGNTCPAASIVLTASAGFSTYQWLFNGVLIAGATSSAYGATVSGNYSVAVTDGDGCAGISTDHAVLIVFCSTSEVSPIYAAFPARLTKDANSSTGYYLYFQRIDAADGYNLYEGSIGTWYSHGGAAGNVCHVSPNALTDLRTGEIRAAITPSEGDRYYLVTAYAGTVEGPSGFASSGLERDPAQNTCAPP